MKIKVTLALLTAGVIIAPMTAWAAGAVSQSVPQGGFIGGLPSSPFELPSSAVQAAPPPPPIQQQSPIVPALPPPPPPVSAPASAPAAPATGVVNPLCVGLTPEQQAAIPLCQQPSQ